MMTFNTLDDASYYGQFSNDVIDGYGMFKSRSRVYEGEFLENKRHGKGKFKFWSYVGD